jgi:CheY-like chemotaxis protein
MPELVDELIPPAQGPVSGEVADDRDDLGGHDRRLLVIGAEPDLATMALEEGRALGYKVLVATRGGGGLSMAREYRPDAVLLDLDIAHADGMAVLAHLKHEGDLRHIPVQVCTTADRRHAVLRAGALSVLEKPVSSEDLSAGLRTLTRFIERGKRRLIVVEDDETQRTAIIDLIGRGDDVEIVGVESSEAALDALQKGTFDCMILDLKLPKTTGFSLLESIKADEDHRDLPVIIYTGKDLTKREETRLRKYAETIIVKDARSPERLLDETALFLHRAEDQLPAEQRRMLDGRDDGGDAFTGKKILIVDDDVRNVFALTSVLERVGMEVAFAENGREGIELLEANPDVDVVLMDVMMPEMDGYEASLAIRQMPGHAQLPIIALTAKAMKGDREKCIAAGASDYITKPVDTDQLLSLLRVWLHREPPDQPQR